MSTEFNNWKMSHWVLSESTHPKSIYWTLTGVDVFALPAPLAPPLAPRVTIGWHCLWKNTNNHKLHHTLSGRSLQTTSLAAYLESQPHVGLVLVLLCIRSIKHGLFSVEGSPEGVTNTQKRLLSSSLLYQGFFFKCIPPMATGECCCAV